jgi:hypothetical protein
MFEENIPKRSSVNFLYSVLENIRRVKSGKYSSTIQYRNYIFPLFELLKVLSPVRIPVKTLGVVLLWLRHSFDLIWSKFSRNIFDYIRHLHWLDLLGFTYFFQYYISADSTKAARSPKGCFKASLFHFFLLQCVL